MKEISDWNGREQTGRFDYRCSRFHNKSSDAIIRTDPIQFNKDE